MSETVRFNVNGEPREIEVRAEEAAVEVLRDRLGLTGTKLVCGEGVSIPIRVRFDDLEPEKRPASSDPSFAALWRETGGEEGIIQRTIKRWRGHGR